MIEVLKKNWSRAYETINKKINKLGRQQSASAL